LLSLQLAAIGDPIGVESSILALHKRSLTHFA
jgi:hypothetical protein